MPRPAPVGDAPVSSFYQGGACHAGVIAKVERVCIADEIEVVIVEVRGNRVRLGFRAPSSVSIQRKERKVGAARSMKPDARGAPAGLAVVSCAAK
jgi:hypothetical protein